MEKTTSAQSYSDIDLHLRLSSIPFFTKFLLDKIEQVSEEYVLLYFPQINPLLKLLDENDRQEIKRILKEDLLLFLEAISNLTVFENELLKNNKNSLSILSRLPTPSVIPMDLNLKLSLLNQLFYKFLPSYTSQVEECLHILQEFEEIRLFLLQKLSSLKINPIDRELRDERNFAESLIAHSSNGILSFNRDLTVSMWNKKMEAISGKKKDAVVGKNILELFPDYKGTEEGEAIFRVLRGENVILSERAYANEKGYFEASAIPIFGVANEIIGGVIIFNDTTRNRKDSKKIEKSKIDLQQLNDALIIQINELKKTQEELKKNEKLLRKTQQLAHMGTWVWDVRDNSIQYSEEFCEIFRISKEHTSDSIKGYMLKVFPDDRSLFLKRIRDAVRSKNPFNYQHRIIHPDGNLKYVYVEGIPEVMNGKFVITGFAQDISQKVKALETLQASENRFRALCEKSPDAIFLLDRNNILYCNHSAIAMFGGQAKSQLLGHSLFEFSRNTGEPDMGYTELKENLTKSFEGISLRFECVLNNLSGDAFWAEVIFTPIKLEDKDVIHAVIRDISLRKEIEDQIKLAQEELEKINNELESRIEARTKDLEDINKNLMRVNADMDNFIYSASHDLKAPILNIEGIINELVQHPCYKDEEVKVLVDLMMVCVQKFTRTIQDLSDITKSIRSDVGDHDINYLEDIITDIKVSIQNMIFSSHAEIHYDFSACNSVLFSRKNLYSVLYNLISNGIKYRSPERVPIIRISTKDLGDHVLVSVKDNGLGLKEKDKEKVFLMFKRAHNHVEGSGVGLFLVKRIMENSGGRVELESRLGEGSEFKLYFIKEPERIEAIIN